MAERNEIPNRMTALGLLEQMRRSNANRQAPFDPVAASARERREAPRASQAPLPLPPTPPTVIPPPQAAPQAAAPQAHALPVPPQPPAVIPRPEGSSETAVRFNLQNPYVATANQMAERYGLPPNVLLSLLHQESRFNPNAVSRAGALGIGQLMPGTAAELGVDPRNPTQNIEGSARYLRQQLDRFGGDMRLALAAYNAGPRRVVEAGNEIPNNKETQAYVPTVMRNAGVPGYAHGGLAHLEHKYAAGDLVEVPGVATPIPGFDYHVRATRIRQPRTHRPAPREELTANQLNDMVLDRIAGRAAPATEVGVPAEARERIGRTMGYDDGGLVQPYVSGGGSGTRVGNSRIVGYGGNAGLDAQVGGGRLDTSISGQGMSSHAGGHHRQHHRIEGVNLGYTTPSGDRFTLGFHDRLMAPPDTLPGANPMEIERGMSPSRGVRVGFSRAFADGGLAELEHKYEGGGPVSLLTGLARRMTRRTPALRPDEVPMVAAHNAREIGLQKIAENDGVVVAPSIGISRVDDPMTDFGEISLIASPQTVDPRRTPVYGRDAYTPRYPSVIPMTVHGQEKNYVRLYNENTGQTRLLPHTPQNALRVMTNEPWRGGENFITDNWLLGQMTPQFRNMSELRGARDRLVPNTDTQLTDWQINLSRLRDEWRNALGPNYGVYSDSFERNLAEAAQRGPGGMEHINRTYYDNAIPPSLLERTTIHLNAGRDLPTTYFEAKPRRIVPLSEFEGAVVPQQASKDVTDLLRRYGVDDIQYYNRGDEADRAAQIRRFEQLMFGAAPVAAGAAVAADERDPSLEELDQRYADGGPVMSDEEYDRRLLSRMKRDTGRTTESTNAEQAQALRNAGYDAAQLASDIFMPQSPLDAALMVAMGPGPRMARLAGSAALAALEPSEAEAGVVRRVGRALGRAGAGAADTALEAAVTPVARTRRRGTIGIIPEETPSAPAVMPSAAREANAAADLQDETLRAYLDRNSTREPTVRTLPEGEDVLGLRNYDLSQVPDVPQVDLPRVVPPKGVSARMSDLVSNEDVWREYTDLVRNGRDNLQGREWYNMEPLRHAFVRELGEDEGTAAFRHYTQNIAATSPRSNIIDNMRNASYYFAQEPSGLILPVRQPAPYGHLAQNLHRQNVETIRSPEGWDLFANPKPPSFAENLGGNQRPGTMDAHALSVPSILSRDPRFLTTNLRIPSGGDYLNLKPRASYGRGVFTMDEAVRRPQLWDAAPNPNEYGALEQRFRRLGEDLDMTTAQAQASGWVGGGRISGLTSPPLPAVDVFQRVVNRTAAQEGRSPQEVLRGFIHRQNALRAAAPVAIGVGANEELGGYAHGGLAQLENKYADGGIVNGGATPYDPDAVNALANQIEAGYV
jgi:soluble lytic murein transglycosylase-like protein